MSKKLYIYEMVDCCEPGSGAYHEQGGLVVITDGYPNDAVPRGTGNRFKVDGEEKFGLPEADFVVEVPDDTPEQVFVFPDSGCC